MEQKEHVYLALDSCLLSTLAYLDTDEISLSKKKMKDYNIDKYSGYLVRFLRFIKQDRIRVVLLPTVHEETLIYDLTHNNIISKFLNKYAYTKKYSVLDSLKFTQDVLKLSNDLCTPYKYADEEIVKTNENKKSIIEIDGVKYYRSPMHKVYNANLKSYTPENDAYIASEAILSDIELVTFNEKDFCKDYIKYGIKIISTLNGFNSELRTYSFVRLSPKVRAIDDEGIDFSDVFKNKQKDNLFEKIDEVPQRELESQVKIYKTRPNFSASTNIDPNQP